MSTEIHGGLALIAAPAATDRIALGTAPNAGGYSLRGSFLWKDASGKFNADGPVLGGGPATSGSLGFAVNYSGANVLNTFGGLYSSGGTAIGFGVKPLSGGSGWASSTGIGAFGRCGLSMDGNALRVGFAGVTTTANDTAIALTEFMTLLATGNFGLGTISPQKKFVVSNGGGNGFEVAPDEANYTRLLSYNRSTGQYTPMFLEASDIRLALGGTDPAIFNSTGLGIGHNNPQMPIHVVRADQSYARIRIQNTGGGGRAYDLVAGIPGVAQGDFSLHDATGEQTLMVWGGTYVRPGLDNQQQLGSASQRFTEVRALNGAIITSDEREKTWRGAPTEAELRAAKRMIAELGFYQWNDEVAKKGKDGARYHFGARAQRVWQIMAEEKLVDPIKKNGKPGATPYAFLCWDEWDEQREPEMKEVEIPATLDADGNEDAPARIERQPTGKKIITVKGGNRYGLRVDQFTLFLVAAQEARLAALEAAIAG